MSIISMTDATAEKPRTITVMRTEVERTGNGRRGTWTLYRVWATDESGEQYGEVLKTFDSLPLGPVEVTFEPFMKDGALQHFTVKSTKRVRRAKATGHEDRIAELEARVETLEKRLNAFIKAFPELES